MNTKRVMFDTNIVIGILNGDIQPESLEMFGEVCISAMTVMEIFALAGMSMNEEFRIRRLLGAMETIPVNEFIAQRAGYLAKTRKRTDRVDVIIAATALELAVPLTTRNIKDFKNVPGLKLFNPFS